MSDPPPLTAPEALAYVNAWHQAVDVQAARIFEGNGGSALSKEVDAYLFSVALRNLIRAVKLVRKLVQPSKQPWVDGALAAFDEDVPNARDLRDVLEHFDSYLQGQGNLQRGGGPSRVVIWTTKKGPDKFSLDVTVDGGSSTMTLDIQLAQGAALRLFDAAVEAVHGD